MTNRQQLTGQIVDIAISNHPNEIPQHVLISGTEGTGKTFIISYLEQEFKSRDYFVLKLFYPHCQIINADYIIDKINNTNNQSSIILIDDFDKLLLSLPTDEQYRLRGFLFKKKAPMLIATSTGLYEDFTDYRAPFYDAFRVFHIPKLEQEDMTEVLPEGVYPAIKNNSTFNDIIKKLGDNLSYIRSMARAFLPNVSTKDALQVVINENERYFRYRFSMLPGVQQRALFGLAHAGEIATSQDVQQISGLTAANTASALFRLEKQNIIVKIGNKKRNVSYKISDYLFGKWLSQDTPQ